MAKFLLTFLGTTDYGRCTYYYQKTPALLFEKRAVRFASEAIFDCFCSDFGPDDAIVVFMTEKAKLCNWDDGYFKEKNAEGSPKEGLYSRLEKATTLSQTPILPVTPIPDGNNEAEIWELFERIYGYLNTMVRPGDELVLDITNAFRSINFFGVVLVQYLRILKQDLRIRGIYYGNYEARDADQRAPLIDVTGIAELLDWTIAAHEFVEAGSAKALSRISKAQDMSRELNAFTKALGTCRGKEICVKMDFNALKAQVLSAQASTGAQKQLLPLLDRIEGVIRPFGSNQVLKNGLAAVEFALQHNLIQQGYTFLQETLISWVIQESGYGRYMSEYLYRFAAGSVLGNFNAQKTKEISPRPAGLLDADIDRIHARMNGFCRQFYGLDKQYKRLTGNAGLRNDINHCGFGQGAASPDVLESELKSVWTNVCRILGVAG